MNNLTNVNEALKNLSEEERELALSILKQMATDGQSAIFDDLKYSDFEEIPVDIDTFLDDDRYLGRGIWAVDEYSGQRRCTLFPYWRETLHKIFPDNLTTACNTLILTGCLGYDTPIPLLNGKIEKIGDLAKIGKLDEYVYSYDVNTNSYVPGHLIKAFSTGIKPVYEITLDNGQKIKATSNHKFMTRDKHWKSIDTGLAVGDSMMPFNTKTGSIADRDGYEIIENPNKDGTTSDIFTHRLVMNWKIGGYSGVVHHKDYNKLNNDPRNLQLMTWQAHKIFHAKRGGMQWQAFNEKRRLGLISPELEQKIRDGALLGNKNRWADENEHKKMSALTTNRMNNGLAKEMANIVWNGSNADLNRQKVINNIVTANTDPKRIEQYQISKAIKVGNLAIKDFGELTKDSYEQTKLKYNMRSGYPSFEAILNRISLQELTEQAAAYNHKIIKIEFIGNEEVFDLTVEKYHNFAIKDGIVAHNSIGLGKTLMAVLCMLYLLYRMLCLKDPYSYYGMMPSDKITFAMLNITLDAAQGVGWDKLQQLVQSSDWFMTHGELNASRTNPQWQPPKGIELIFGSNNRHVVGRALFCLDGETEILTTAGIKKLQDLVDKDVQVISVDNSGNKCLSKHCTVKPTIKTTEEYQIELVDGTIIKCTPNHRFRLINGTYKEAQYLTEADELMETQVSYFEYIDTIIKTRGQWALNTGFEGHHIIPKCFGGGGNTKTKHANIIRLTPEEHFVAHKLLALENPNSRSLVSAWEMMAYPKGKTKRTYAISAKDYALLRKLWSKHMSENNPGLCNNGHPWNYGTAKPKIKKERTGNKNKVCITNGTDSYYINKDIAIPEGYTYGMTCHKKHIIKDPIAFSKQKSEQCKGSGNPMFGHGEKISGGKNGKATKRYFYKNIAYECRIELVEALKSLDARITISTIRKLEQGSARVLREHPILENVRWEAK